MEFVKLTANTKVCLPPRRLLETGEEDESHQGAGADFRKLSEDPKLEQRH